MRSYQPMSPFGCGRAVRRGCGCLVGVLVILVLLACMLGYGVSRGFVSSAHADGPSDVTATQLAPGVPEAPRTTTARGVFYTTHVSVTVGLGQIRLAGSANGTGQLCTDDRATLTFRSASGRPFVWQHTFHQNVQTGIYCIPPVDLTSEVTPGIYDVAVQLEDVVPYTYSSTAYYLVVLPEPTSTPSPSPSVSPTATRVVAEAPVSGATPTAAPREPTPTSVAATDDGPGAGASGLPLWRLLALVVVGVVGLGGAFALIRRPGQGGSARPYLSGTMDLTDGETGESRQVGLFQHPRGARITRHPLNLVGLASQPGSGETVGYLLPSAQGPLLYLDPPGAGGVRDGAMPTLIQPEHSYKVAGDLVEVCYRPFDPTRARSSMRRASGRA